MHKYKSNEILHQQIIIPGQGKYQEIIDKHSHIHYSNDNIPNPLKGIIPADVQPFSIHMTLLQGNREKVVKSNNCPHEVDVQEFNENALDSYYGLCLCLFLTFLFIIVYTVAKYVELAKYVVFLWIIACIITFYGIKIIVAVRYLDSSKLTASNAYKVEPSNAFSSFSCPTATPKDTIVEIKINEIGV